MLEKGYIVFQGQYEECALYITRKNKQMKRGILWHVVLLMDRMQLLITV